MNNNMHHGLVHGVCCYQGVEADSCSISTSPGEEYCDQHLALFVQQAKNRARIANWFRHIWSIVS